MKNKKVIWSIAIMVLIVLVSSGWVFTYVKSNNEAKTTEMTNLQVTFNQQYGTDGITLKQMISPKKVYVAIWTAKDGTTNVSWNMGGLWITVYTSAVPATTP